MIKIPFSRKTGLHFVKMRESGRLNLFLRYKTGFLLALVVLFLGNDPSLAEEKSIHSAQVPSKEEDRRPNELKKICLLFHSKVETKFIGFFVAKELGLYEKRGLPTIEFKWSLPGEKMVDRLRENEVQLATSWMNTIYRANSTKDDLVTLAHFTPQIHCGILVRRDLHPGISNLKQLNGCHVAVRGPINDFASLVFAHHKINVIPVQYIEEGFPLLRHDAVAGMFYISWGEQVNQSYTRYRNQFLRIPFPLSSTPIPGGVLACRRDFLYEYPDLCQSFVRATFLGYLLAKKDPDRALSILQKYYISKNLVFDRYLCKKQLEITLKTMDIHEPPQKNGDCSRSSFELMRSLLCEDPSFDKTIDLPFERFFYPMMESKTLNRVKQEAKATQACCKANAKSTGTNSNNSK